MKKFILSIVTCLTALPLFVPTLSITPVFAEGIYLRVITNDTPFFASIADQNPLFYLTYTYYVKVLGYEQDFVHVECFGIDYPAVDGYVPKDTLYNDKSSVTFPYPSIVLTTIDTAILYADPSMQQNIQYVFPERNLNYYGKLPLNQNENLYYVGYNGKLGYVKESFILPFTIPNHPNELTFLNPVTPNDTPTNESPVKPPSTSTLTLRWVVIGCLILAGIFALILTISKRPKRVKIMPDNSDYYDEN